MTLTENVTNRVLSKHGLAPVTRCDMMGCGGERCTYETCPCSCHLYALADVLHEGPNVSHRPNPVGTFLARSFIAAGWVVVGLACAVTFICMSLGWMCWLAVAGGLYGGWRVIFRSKP
jgi:hypothetical protein